MSAEHDRAGPWNAGWLDSAEQCPSPNFDERPNDTPVDLLVIHNISLPANRFGGPYIEHLFTNALDCGAHPSFADLEGLHVSAHFLVRRDGHCQQFVGVDKRAWHAGKSEWQRRQACNDFSVGIEMEGCDHLPFEPVQYDALAALTQSLRAYFPLITPSRIVGHCDIAPGRKTDPGPCFDWAHYRNLL